jgi:hypothetical protein
MYLLEQLKEVVELLLMGIVENFILMVLDFKEVNMKLIQINWFFLGV